jgi:hypothetical protein
MTTARHLVLTIRLLRVAFELTAMTLTKIPETRTRDGALDFSCGDRRPY